MLFDTLGHRVEFVVLTKVVTNMLAYSTDWISSEIKEQVPSLSCLTFFCRMVGG